MNIRNFSLLGSLVLSGLVTLGACGSSSSSSGTGGATGSLGGATGSLGGAKGVATGGTTGAAGGTIGSAGGTVGTAGGHIGSAGGSTITGTGGAGGSAGSVSCPDTAVPSCLQGLSACAPAGTCVRQKTGSSASGMIGNNQCYSNGVKEIGVETIDAVAQTVSINITVSKGGSVCFIESVTEDLSSTAPAVFTIKNGSGVTVATLTDTADGTGSMVTCTGGTPVVLPNGCDFSGVMDMTTGDCTDGACQ